MVRVFGLEQEVSLAAFDQAGQRIDPRRAAERIYELALARLPHLPARGSAGIFLQNGARFYIDCGKPEMTTPEVCRPADACRYVRAGEQILEDLARDLPQFDSSISKVVITRCNVSYGPGQFTCGNHESYNCGGDPLHLPTLIIPHLVTRQIFTGAGGFDNTSPGIEFMLSPRVRHLSKPVSSESQRNRGIFHTKDESLSQDGTHRLHLLCGEALASQTALWLRMATTALVVGIAEAGHLSADDVMLARPVQDMLALSKDPTLAHPLTLHGGGKRTAIEIQRHYLCAVESRLGDAQLPDWAPQACAAWRSMLGRLEQGVEAVRQTLDWAIKLSLFQRHARNRGFDWDTLLIWNRILRRLRRAQVAQPTLTETLDFLELDEGYPDLTPPMITGDGPVADAARRQGRYLQRAGLDWADLGKVLDLRQELFELDTRFGELSESGVFARLDQCGVLDHRMADVHDVDAAVTNPPGETRAALRGAFVKKFSGQGAGYWCDWMCCCNESANQILDLHTALLPEEKWRTFTRSEVAASHPHDEQVARMLHQLNQEYDSGRYDAALRLIDTLQIFRRRLSRAQYVDLSRYAAWTQARRGEVSGPTILDSLYRGQTPTLSSICDYACIYRFQGLAPPPEIEPWLAMGEALIARGEPDEPGIAAALVGHQAYYLLCQNQVDEAQARIEPAMRPAWFDRTHWRTRSRLLAEQAEVLRRQGNEARAAQLLDQAELIADERVRQADVPELIWARRAKLLASPSPTAARALLRRARHRLSANGQAQGIARILLLEARLRPRRSVFSWSRTCDSLRQRIARLRDDRPALSRCTLLARVLDHWEAWTRGDMIDGETDYFWRV